MVINCSQNKFFFSDIFLIPHNNLVKIKGSLHYSPGEEPEQYENDLA